MAKRVRVLALVVAGMLIGGCAQPRPTPTPVPSPSSPPASPSSPPASPSSPPSSPSRTPSSPAADPSGPASSLPALVVEARDLSFTPRQLAAPVGTDVALTLHNGGRIVHNVTIDELAVQLVASPGQTRTVELTDLPAGTYAFYCSVSGHRQAGMEGTLTVS